MISDLKRFSLQYIPIVGDNVLGIVVDTKADVSSLGLALFFGRVTVVTASNSCYFRQYFCSLIDLYFVLYD